MGSEDLAITGRATDAATGARVRAARASDGEFIIPLVARLAEFGPPPWRDAALMTTAECAVIAEALRAPAANEAIFVAEGGDAQPLGFIHLVTAVDYFTREAHGHVSALVVSPAGEGRGVGRALMGAGEWWARRRGYQLLTLNVFARNTRALKFYERLGYGADTLKYAKELG
ncbi:MAG TPA: GNAT family N-acetyltransferase [Pyrinomonadaceae bacterium]|jgi:GNAT superfamily N-acetyltransferase|nr:GNAT family N-acetyltransferase [Pyrinomonadaceae bacterium]